MLVLFTDTDTDITPKEAEKLGYKLISMPYIIDDKTIHPFENGNDYDYKAFYDTLRKGIIPKTCAISPMDYINYFEPEFAKGNDILYVHFSKAMSGTFNSMEIALNELKDKYPQRKLYTIDTKGITILSYNIVKEVADLYKENKSIEEILEWAKEEVDHFAVYFYADDLNFFKRSGRISNFSAIMGGLIGIHPIIHIGDDGMMVSISKARGKKNTLQKILDYVEELELDIKSHRVIIGHSDAIDTANLMADMLKEKFGNDLKIEFVYVNPTAGSHCGPSNVGVCFHAKKR